MKIIDISPTVSPSIGVFPDDVPYSRSISMAFDKGDHLLLSSINTTLHLGAHADAPNHYHPEGGDIATRSLHFYLGPCQVIHVPVAPGARIYPKDLKGVTIRQSRVLLRTDSFPDPDHWNGDFASLSPELITFLSAKKVQLIGIDTPSVDPEPSKALESHDQVFREDLAILEGLVLKHVAPGDYFLVALPLKLADADASPVRAVLLEGSPMPVKRSSDGGT